MDMDADVNYQHETAGNLIIQYPMRNPDMALDVDNIPADELTNPFDAFAADPEYAVDNAVNISRNTTMVVNRTQSFNQQQSSNNTNTSQNNVAYVHTDSHSEQSPLNKRNTNQIYDPDSQVFKDDDDVPDGISSSWSVAFNIIKGCLGAGLLTMPWATQNIGLLPAIVVQLLSFVAAFVGWIFLFLASDKLEVYEYRQLVFKLFGSKAALSVDISLLTFLFFVCVLYVIFIGQFVSVGFIKLGYTDINVENGFGILSTMTSFEELVASKLFINTVFVFLLLYPLTLLKKLDSLKYSSLLGIVASLYVVAISLYEIISVPSGVDGTHVQWFNLHTDAHTDVTSGSFVLFWLESFAIFSAAFNTHFNAPPLYGELKDRSPMKMLTLSSVSFIIVLVINAVLAMCFYFVLGTNIDQNILDSLSGLIITIARLVMVFAMSGSYPLLFFNIKISFKHLIFYDHSFIPPKPRRYTNMLTEYLVYFLITCLVWLVSVMYSDVGTLLGFMQSLFGNAITFIIPPIIYLKVLKIYQYRNAMDKTSNVMQQIVCWSVIVFGALASLGGLLSSVLSMAGVIQ